MNKLDKFTLITVLIVIFSSNNYAQNLQLNDLQTICNKPNWDYVNQYLMNKGWEYYESEKGSSIKYNTITWSLNKSYGDKAEGWFHLYTFEGFPNKIAYSVFNKPAYTKIQNSLSSLGYKLTGSEIKDNEITSTYTNNKFKLEITTKKREKKDDFSYSGESITAYRFLLIKKNGVYDPDNGKKVDYWDEDVIKAEYSLKEGKLEGPIKTYYENGVLKVQGFYKNGKANGKFIEFDDNGNKTAEYNMLDDQLNGLAVIFEKNKKSIEKVYEKGALNGNCTEYYFDNDGNLSSKVIGYFKNDKKNGTWVTLFGNEKDTLEIRNYKNDLRHGYFKEYINSDSIEISNYNNDLREGLYILKTKAKAYMTDDFLPISWWSIACEGVYSKGQRFGSWRFYTLGKLREEGKYVNGEKSGKWTEYVTIGNREGEILSETEYRNDIKNGIFNRYFYIDFDPDSASENVSGRFHYIPIYESYSYTNGAKYGDYLLKDSLGNTQVRGQYFDDLESGLWIVYDDNNNIACTTSYDKGFVIEESYFENNEKYLNEKYENGDLKKIEFYKNSKLREEHIIISKGDKYIVNLINYESADTIYSYTYEVNSKEKYNYRIFSSYGTKQGEFFMKVNNVKIVTGQYNSNLKSGYWIYYYPSQNAYSALQFQSGDMISELFYDNSDKQFFSGELSIDKPNNHKEIIKIKKGLRNGKTRLLNENNEEFKVIKYKKGIQLD